MSSKVPDLESASLYEAVDYEMLPQSSAAAGAQSKYKSLRSDHNQWKQNYYQQLNVSTNDDSETSDLKKELKSLRREVRCTKIALIVGLVVVVCMAGAIIASMALSVQEKRHISRIQPKANLTDDTSHNKTEVISTRDCYSDTTSCDVIHLLQNSRLVCNTPTRAVNKKV